MKTNNPFRYKNRITVSEIVGAAASWTVGLAAITVLIALGGLI